MVSFVVILVVVGVVCLMAWTKFWLDKRIRRRGPTPRQIERHEKQGGGPWPSGRQTHAVPPPPTSTRSPSTPTATPTG